MDAYWSYLGPMDWFIIGYGALLMAVHIVLIAARYLSSALWARQGLGVRRQFLLALSELLPLMGLLGTVVALLNTFLGMDSAADGYVDIPGLIHDFAPALTTTASGIIFVLINLFLNSVLWLVIPSRLKEEEAQEPQAGD
ncbi:MAG: MotA/TolQ/ExbB proton channel family protein [Thermoguttaceae bacterium]|nr:MotA/TolQ/ExbB proton channel family protein [Thermoguttaceae bacterium]